MALNVHSNQQEQLLENSQRISSECKREYQNNNKKITGSVPGGTLAVISLFCSCALLYTQRAKSLLKKNLLSCYLPSFPYQDSNTCFHTFFSFSHIYIYIIPQDLNLFPKKKIPLFPFFFSSFLFLKSSQKAIFPISNFPPKPFEEGLTFLKLQW